MDYIDRRTGIMGRKAPAKLYTPRLGRKAPAKATEYLDNADMNRYREMLGRKAPAKVTEYLDNADMRRGLIG